MSVLRGPSILAGAAKPASKPEFVPAEVGTAGPGPGAGPIGEADGAPGDAWAALDLAGIPSHQVPPVSVLFGELRNYF